MPHLKTLHLLLVVLAGWGALTVTGCSVKSDGLGAVDSGAAENGGGGHALAGAPGSGGGPLSPGGAGTPSATGGSGAGPLASGTGGIQPAAGSGGEGLPSPSPSPGTGGQSAGDSGVGGGRGGEVGTASGGAGTAGSQGNLPVGSGGMKAAETGGQGTGGKGAAGGTGGGSGGRAAGSGGSGATPDCSGIPKPPVAPGACSKGQSVLECVASATDPGRSAWVVSCPGQDPSQDPSGADAGATDARQRDDGGAAVVCAASFDCPMNQVCTTQDGECNPPPGCPSMGGRGCSGGCYGTCRVKMAPPPSGGCRSDGDCRIQEDTCMGCSCIALGQNEMAPGCPGQGQGQGPGPGPGSRCFQDPCSGQHARCQQGSCVASRN
jgi:hypothetical protein